MASLPAHTGFAFTGLESLHKDICPSISPAATPALKQPDKAILVTGASRGIGRAIALQYAHAGVGSLILCARSMTQLEETKNKIVKIDSSIRGLKIAVDVTDEKAVERCAKDVREKIGRLDVLINNAGRSEL